MTTKWSELRGKNNSAKKYMLSCLLQGHHLTVYYFLMSRILQKESDSFAITNLYWIYLFLLSKPTLFTMLLGSWKKDFTIPLHFALKSCLILNIQKPPPQCIQT